MYEGPREQEVSQHDQYDQVLQSSDLSESAVDVIGADCHAIELRLGNKRVGGDACEEGGHFRVLGDFRERQP